MVARHKRYETGGPGVGHSARKTVARVLTVLVTCAVAAVIIFAGVCFLIFRGPSGAARDLVVTTLLETPALDALPQVFLTDSQIADILARSSMGSVDVSVQDPQLVDYRQEQEESRALDRNAVDLLVTDHATFRAQLLVVNDPNRMRVAVPGEFGDRGLTIEELCGSNVAAIGAGLVDATRGEGGYPVGVVVCNGKARWLDTSEPGLYLVGFDGDGLLRIIDIRGKADFEVEQVIKDEDIRHAVTVSDRVGDLSASFGPIIVNGAVREYQGTGSGESARTAIGQRADGAVLLLTCSGNLLAGRAGATAQDLIAIMSGAGAVNACALSEGARAQMVYEGETLAGGSGMFATGDRQLMPSAFVVGAR